MMRSFFHNQEGSAAIEMAAILPVIFTMFMGMVEVSNFVMVTQRTEKLAHNLADMVAQAETITTSQLNTIMDASSQIMQPFPFGQQGHVIITSVHRNVGEGPKVAWQYEGGGKLKNDTSNFGSTGFSSPLPSGFTLEERETVIIAEVFYDSTPFLTNMFESDGRVYKYAFYKPRLGSLDTVQTQ